MGFIEETGAAQYLRDCRITPIYEGTTGIQANDLLGRKTQFDGGKGVDELLTDMRATHEALSSAEHSFVQTALADVVDMIASVKERLVEEKNPAVAAAAASDYLMMMGYATGTWAMARMVLASGNLQVALAKFYCDKIAPHARAHFLAIENSKSDYYELDQAVL